MAVQIISAILASITAIIVAVIEGTNIKSKKKRERLEKQREQLEKQRATEARLAMDMQAASLELSDVIAIAVTGGHTNGNVEAARKKAHDAKIAYYNFINTVAAESLAKR